MLFAEELRKQQEDVVQSVNFWLTIGLLMTILLGGAVVLSLTERWRKRQAQPTRGGLGELSLYREMYEDGELDEEEYRAIRDRLAAELKGRPPAPVPVKGVGEASGASPDGPPVPPPEPPAKAPPIS